MSDAQALREFLDAIVANQRQLENSKILVYHRAGIDLSKLAKVAFHDWKPTKAMDKAWTKRTGLPPLVTADDWLRAAVKAGYSSRDAITASRQSWSEMVDAIGLWASTLGPVEPPPKLEWLAHAMLLKKANPNWTDARIAEEIGVVQSNLSKSPEYKILRDSVDSGREARRGVRRDDGDVDAWDDREMDEIDD